MLFVEKRLRVIQLQLNRIFNVVHGNAPNYLKSNYFFLNEHRSQVLTPGLARCLLHILIGTKALNSSPSAPHNITKNFLKGPLRNIYLMKFLK